MSCRIRFNDKGEIKSIISKNDQILDNTIKNEKNVLIASALERDCLREDEGSIPSTEAYSILETLVLLRSSVPGHRSYALRILQSILKDNHPKIFNGINLNLKIY